MTKNDTSLVLTKKLSETKKAALAQAGSVLKAAGFSCWTISAGNSVDEPGKLQPGQVLLIRYKR